MLVLRDSLLGNVLWRESQGYGEKPFASAKAIEGVTHESSQSSQQKPGIDAGLPRNDLCRTLLSNGIGKTDYISEHGMLAGYW